MKILILSDSHRLTDYLKSILTEETNIDAIIHLGDGADDLSNMSEYTSGKPIYQLKGNCDLYSYNLTSKLISYADGIKFLACHGHDYNVKYGLTSLFYAAKEAQCQIALFGHTHIPYKEKIEDVTLFNPGSVMKKQYGILEINNNHFEITHKEI